MSHPAFTLAELAIVRLEGDDYGGVTAYCRTCDVPVTGTHNGRAPMRLGDTEYGDPVELLRPALEHVRSAHRKTG